ncbi:CAP domain-containing protein [Tardiphaga sp. 172_B4_N1_3]|uniref:CAP domain-containing protein n=1 Tax=Tardiphaga sp. 172_B4_N1_3 TaxID=3240787 RepID=UPI003F899915
MNLIREAIVMTYRPLRLFVLCGALIAATIVETRAADYASQISAFRRAHKLSSVTLDSKLNAVALAQAQAMSSSGKVSHEVGGVFSARVGKLRKSKAAENIAAGFLTFPETLRQWEESPGHRENLLMSGARKVGVAYVANPKSPYRMFWAMVITD